MPSTAVADVQRHDRVWRLSWDDPSAHRAPSDVAVLALLRSRYDVARRVAYGQLVVEEYRRR